MPINDLHVFKVTRQFKVAGNNPNQQVFYRNKEELNRKISAIKQDSLENFQIIADFDHTLTTG